jgi:hypothetical protein
VESPLRISRFILQLPKYDFKVNYKAGKTMNVARKNVIPYIDINQIQLNAHLPMSEEKCRSLKKASEEDEDMQCIKPLIGKIWPEKQFQTQLNARENWSFIHNLK